MGGTLWEQTQREERRRQSDFQMTFLINRKAITEETNAVFPPFLLSGLPPLTHSQNQQTM